MSNVIVDYKKLSREMTKIRDNCGNIHANMIELRRLLKDITDPTKLLWHGTKADDFLQLWNLNFCEKFKKFDRIWLKDLPMCIWQIAENYAYADQAEVPVDIRDANEPFNNFQIDNVVNKNEIYFSEQMTEYQEKINNVLNTMKSNVNVVKTLYDGLSWQGECRELIRKIVDTTSTEFKSFIEELIGIINTMFNEAREDYEKVEKKVISEQ